MVLLKELAQRRPCFRSAHQEQGLNKPKATLDHFTRRIKALDGIGSDVERWFARCDQLC